MTLIGSMGRWHGGTLPADKTQAAQHLRNEIRRHQGQITELLAKKRDVAMTIASHYGQIRRLKRAAAKQGIPL